jgi:hypothetical protein
MAQADYFADVFDRWVRMFGPPVTFPPNFSHYHRPTTEAGVLADMLSNESMLVARRISKCIDSYKAKSSFEKRIDCAFSCDDKMAVRIYINGNKYTVADPAKTSRIKDMLFLYSVLGRQSAIEDAAIGLAAQIK